MLSIYVCVSMPNLGTLFRYKQNCFILFSYNGNPPSIKQINEFLANFVSTL